VELADAVFCRQPSIRTCCTRRCAGIWLGSAPAPTNQGRGEVSGSGRKLWRQKGTGRARVGSIRSSIWRKAAPCTAAAAKLRLRPASQDGAGSAALGASAKFADQKLTVVDGWTLGSHKTKEFRQTLARLDGETRTILLVQDPGNRNLELASRNLDGVKVVAAAALQPYDLLRHDRIMLSKETALRLGRSLSGAGADSAAAEEAAAVPAAKEHAVSPPKAAEAAGKKAAAKKPAAAKPRAARKPAAKPKAKE